MRIYHYLVFTIADLNTQPMSSLHALQTRYTQLNDDFNVLTSRHKPATPEQIHAFEHAVNLRLSDDVKEFLTGLGQLIVEVKEDVWARPKEMEVLPMWKFGYGFYVFGLSQEPGVPEWMTFDYYFDEEETPVKGQQFFQRSGNSYRAYILDGKITIEYDHYGEDTEPFEGNLFDFLLAEIEKLETDYRRYLSGEE